jgi:hypothetical protein
MPLLQESAIPDTSTDNQPTRAMTKTRVGILPSTLISALAWVLASVLTSTAAANEAVSIDPEPEPPRWFQIELVVFTQPDAQLSDEFWNEQLQPNYDDNAIVLLPGSAPAASLDAPIRPGMQSDRQEQELTIPSDQPQAIDTGSAQIPATAPKHATLAALNSRQLPELYSQLYPQPVVISQADQSNGSDSATKRPIKWPDVLPQIYHRGAFALLSKEQLAPPSPEVDNNPPQPSKPEQKAIDLKPIDLKRLQRKGHRILFHGNWRQPVLDRQHSRSIIIRGGNALDAQHFELEGDIKLSLSRYLHLWPQLYLSLQLPPDWNTRDPKTILALSKAQLLLQQAQTLSQTPFYPAAFSTDQQFETAELATLNRTLMASPETTPRFQITTEAPLFATQPLFPPTATFGAPIADNQQPVQPPARYLTVQLNQPRRMRSGELHYLDHPLFGLLIRITPYTLPVIEQLLPLDGPTGSAAATSVATESLNTNSSTTTSPRTPAAPKTPKTPKTP